MERCPDCGGFLYPEVAHHCPVRQACELPQIEFPGLEPRPNWLRVCDAIGVALGLGIVICIAALAVGVWA